MRNGEAKVQLINWPKGQIGLVIFSDFYPEIDINPHMYIWGKSQYTALALESYIYVLKISNFQFHTLH
jgi:hypothetical protein